MELRQELKHFREQSEKYESENSQLAKDQSDLRDKLTQNGIELARLIRCKTEADGLIEQLEK